MEHVIIPISIFASIAAVIISYFYWNHKNRHALMHTVQKSIESGNTITPELLTKLSSPMSPKLRDFRRGVVVFMIGVAGMISAFFIDDVELISAFRALSMFPLLVGAGFLIVWKVNPDQE